ncbi:lysosomal alpha-mannosidase-like [Tropilaelaps mercedesae]|uniref:Lysosomal alpha-mannosidase-like n=1 Tax=Tropilaelaps mercedesae TaxID=418985 RepID=A0A1V9XGK3_9ACAR|nr:lysosomal alpha-mannosidase-like [Tropilaelaps mercedesae]
MLKTTIGKHEGRAMLTPTSSQMGFDGLFLGRIHFEEKEWRERHQEMEMVWQTDPSQRKEGELFTGILPNVYWPPKGFCFDMYCDDEEINVSSDGFSRLFGVVHVQWD